MSDELVPPMCGGKPMDYDALTRMWECACGRDVADESRGSAAAWAAFDHLRAPESPVAKAAWDRILAAKAAGRAAAHDTAHTAIAYRRAVLGPIDDEGEA